MIGRLLPFLILLPVVSRGIEPEIRPGQMPRMPATEPDRATATFSLRPGFRAELVAAEPLVNSPVAVTVDAAGRAYVVEMRDYSERRPEQLGRIRRLEDTDGDGRYDKATVFLAGLPWPTAVTCWDGGVFIGATPDILYAKDTDGDGVADIRQVVFTGFASDYAPYATNKLNVQALMNSFQWGLDDRIHGATSMSGGKVRLVDSEFTRSWLVAGQGGRGAGEPRGGGETSSATMDLRGRDFSFDPRTLSMRAETGGGQHGMSFDATGRKFVCSNSDHLQLIAFDETAAPSNPFHELPAARSSIAADGPAAEVHRRSPDEPWRVLRTRWRVAGVVEGPVEGGGRPSGYFTGATGTTLYRGDAYGPDFAGDAFIGDAGSNLVHRKKLRIAPDGILLIGERPADEPRSEFLASTDNWFRPVQFYNAPDGCLWVVDMYRETIEHPWSLPENLKKNLDLDSGRERGRIWRMTPTTAVARGPWSKPQGLGTAGLVAMLAHPDGWHRDTAARLLVERADPAAVPALKALLAPAPGALAGGVTATTDAKGPSTTSSAAPSAATRIAALHLLRSAGALAPALLADVMRDADPAVRRHAYRLAGGIAVDPAAARDALAARLSVAAAAETDPLARIDLAFALRTVPDGSRSGPLAALVRAGPATVRSAAIHTAVGIEGALWDELMPVPRVPDFPEAAAVLAELARTIGRRGDAGAVGKLIAAFALLPAPDATGIADALVRGMVVQGHTLARFEPAPSGLLAEAWRRANIRPVPSKRVAAVRPDPDRLAVLAKFLPALDLKGDPARGAVLFRERCTTCHAFRGEGAALGPDLGSVVANGLDKLLVSILDPDREVAPNFAAWTVETKEGVSVTGLLARESDSAVTLKIAGGAEEVFPRARLARLVPTGRSLMPEGLESGLTTEDIAALLAWLTAPARP